MSKRLLTASKYFFIFRLAVIQSIKNYKGLIGLSLFLITCLLVFSHLWKIAAYKMGVDQLDPRKLIWYIALNEWILIAIPEIQTDMEQDLRSGKLAYLLPRPISYLGGVFTEGLGLLVVNLAVLGMVAFLFTWWQMGAFPFDSLTLMTHIGLGLFAGCLALIFQMLIGLSAFWLEDVSPFNWIWEKFLFAFGGLILPLSVYPNWIQKIAAWTPFPTILGQRSSLAIDFNFQDVFYLIVSLSIWTVLGMGSLVFLYRRGLKILNIAGG